MLGNVSNEKEQYLSLFFRGYLFDVSSVELYRNGYLSKTKENPDTRFY